MPFRGDRSQWLDIFPFQLIPDVLRLIFDGWERMPVVQSNAKEVQTTRQFREVLRKVKRFRELPFTIWPESTETDDLTGRERGRIDLRFLHGYKEEAYLAFECKRLYYQEASGRRRANISQYTGDNGLMCYINEKYSRNLPHGGMIGYVLNGDVSNAKSKISTRMTANREILKLRSSPPLAICDWNPDEIRLAESAHDVNGKSLTIYHILLAN